MSYLLQQAYLNQEADPEKLKLAEIQFDAMAITFNNILRTCASKCIPDEYSEAELNKGETCCIDRCVSKFVKANLIMGQNVQRNGFTPDRMVLYNKIHEKLQGSQ